MFSSGPNYTKLKTNLRLAVNRLKLLEKKKAEIAQKSRKEIADFLGNGKTERARIRVEHIIREDYLVEAMEVVEMYCDLLLARFGLVTQMKELDDGIAEAVSSVVWVCPRLQSDISELKVISDIFIQKYGPQFAEKARTATGDHHVSEKLMHKLQLQAPPKLLVEKYLIEIAKNYNIEYEPDPQVLNEEKDGMYLQIKYFMQIKANSLHRRLNRANIIISGLPSGIVDLMALIIKMGSIYDIPICTNDVNYICYLNNRKSILVKFNNVFVRDKIMNEYFKTRSLKVRDLVDGDIDLRVYLNDHYSPAASKLNMLCKKLLRKELIKRYRILNSDRLRVKLTMADDSEVVYSPAQCGDLLDAGR